MQFVLFFFLYFGGVIALAVILLKIAAVKPVIIFEYQRGLKYVRGVYRATLGPGRHWVIGSTRIVPVDVRPVFITIPGQEIVTADGATVKISLAAHYEVVDPNIAINKTQSYQANLYLLLQMALRGIINGEKIEALLENRADISKKLMESVAPGAESIGVRLISADVKDLMLPGDLKRIFSQVLKAQKDGQAALERARGESAALRNLANAAKMVEENPNLLQLRALQMLGDTQGNTLMLGVSPSMVKNGDKKPE